VMAGRPHMRVDNAHHIADETAARILTWLGDSR
jgi:hypothetical protein